MTILRYTRLLLMAGLCATLASTVAAQSQPVPTASAPSAPTQPRPEPRSAPRVIVDGVDLQLDVLKELSLAQREQLDRLKEIDLSTLAHLDEDLQDLRFDLSDVVIPPIPPIAFQIDALNDVAIDIDQHEINRAVQEAQVAVMASAQTAATAAERAERDRERQRDRAIEIQERVNQNSKVRVVMRGCDAATAGTRSAESAYGCGRRALDDAQWDQAVTFFTRAVDMKDSPRVPGALYWKAYALNRLAQRNEALAAIGQLKAGYASSPWVNDANALEIEIKQNSGQRVTPDQAADDDLKLLALQALSNAENTDIVPMIEKLLSGAQAPKVKERALFVLAQNNSPGARALVLQVAKGKVSPDLQMRAVQYLGTFGTPESRQSLAEVYGATADLDVRRSILRGYMAAGDKERLASIARQEQNVELRREAVRQLGAMKATPELVDLYGKEASAEVKREILRGFGVAGDTDRLLMVVKTETNPELKRTAIRSFAYSSKNTSPQLIGLYTKDQAREVKQVIVEALGAQEQAAALVELARKETDPALKKMIVQRLSTMDSKEATAYLLELLK